MATLTVYPVSGANNPVDGYTTRFGVDESLSTIRAGAGNITSNTDVTLYAQLKASSTTNQYAELYRTIMCFDTSALTAGATITGVVLSLAGTGKSNGLGSPDLHISGATPASTAALVDGDYNQLQTTSFGSVPYASWTTTGAYIDITLNASGIAAISKTGITKLGAQTSWDINNSFTGVWSSTATSNLTWSSADAGGNVPKLTITYSLGSASLSPSSSASRSLSPSSSLSPSASASRSLSPSTSNSASTSRSVSPSPSRSPSASPSPGSQSMDIDLVEFCFQTGFGNKYVVQSTNYPSNKYVAQSTSFSANKYVTQNTTFTDKYHEC